MFSVKVPLVGLATTIADKVLFSASVSLATTLVTPPIKVVAVPPLGTEIASATPTGASFTAVIEILTVTVLLSDIPSLAL